MEKNKIRGYVVLAVALVLVSVFAFVPPLEKMQPFG